VVAVPLDTVRDKEEMTTVPTPCCVIVTTDVLSEVLIVPSLFLENTLIVEAAVAVCVPKAMDTVE
jgi:hypothetical protein